MEEVVDYGYGALRARMAETFSPQSMRLIDKAYQTAEEAHRGQKRRSGEPYIIHPIAVAEILFELGMDPPSVETALLHDVVEDTNFKLSDIARMFGIYVADLVGDESEN